MTRPSVATRWITSACAEQTTTDLTGNGTSGDHLRVCGADTVAQINQDMADGSPPRVRSRHWANCEFGDDTGITSACAEQTSPSPTLGVPCPDHLRVCGADRLLPPFDALA